MHAYVDCNAPTTLLWIKLTQTQKLGVEVWQPYLLRSDMRAVEIRNEIIVSSAN